MLHSLVISSLLSRNVNKKQSNFKVCLPKSLLHYQAKKGTKSRENPSTCNYRILEPPDSFIWTFVDDMLKNDLTLKEYPKVNYFILSVSQIFFLEYFISQGGHPKTFNTAFVKTAKHFAAKYLLTNENFDVILAKVTEELLFRPI